MKKLGSTKGKLVPQKSVQIVKAPKTQRLLVNFDKAGAEWVVVAYAAGDANMIKVCESGESPHVHTGHLITGVPKDLISKEAKLLGEMTDAVEIERLRREFLPQLFANPNWFLPRIFSCRQCGKKSNHGLNYGMRENRFALENEMDIRESKKIVLFYSTRAYPNLQTWWDGNIRQIKKNRTLTNCFGRKRMFLGMFGPDLWMEAHAFVPQSTVVDIFNDGLPRLYEDDHPMFRSLRFKGQVHDSAVFQYDFVMNKSGLLEAARAIQKIAMDYLNPEMEYGGRKFRIRTECKIGTHWGQGMIEIGLTQNEKQVAEWLEEGIVEVLANREKEIERLASIVS